jgi:HPt (histidine-containing phosphotransfer) domain-containing protein
MSPTRSEEFATIHSSLASDPQLGELVEQFVAEMPSRVAWLQRHHDSGDWEALRRAAHQMKGAAGSYGFDRLTPHALRLEMLLAAGASQEDVTAAFQELIANCRRVTATARHS